VEQELRYLQSLKWIIYKRNFADAGIQVVNLFLLNRKMIILALIIGVGKTVIKLKPFSWQKENFGQEMN
jgi:hypothetical protein